MSSVVVIIPFYQRDPGILGRALDSVFAQTFPDIGVVIVDDSSPTPPDAEVAKRPTFQRDRIEITRRPNGGPGAARSTGLDVLPATARYAAFLDSDDRWEPGHIETAVESLEAGFDLFFDDYTWPGGTTTRLKETGLADCGTPISPGSEARRIEGDFFESVLSCWPVHLSATVIDVARLGHVRFDARLRYSSEDMHYLLKCADETDRVCYSPKLGVRLDDGLNIYRRQPVGSFGFSRSRLGNAYFHRLIEPQAAARGEAAVAINRRLLRTNCLDFLRSEAKSLLLSGRLNVGLYLEFLKILGGATEPLPAKGAST